MIVYLLLAIPEIIENFEKFITSFGEKIENEILASLGLKTPKKNKSCSFWYKLVHPDTNLYICL